MSHREKLSPTAVEAFVTRQPDWQHRNDALVKAFAFCDYASGIAFVVRVGFAAEARDHHPELLVGYRNVEVRWSTHDAGGVTALDTEMAQLCDRLHPPIP